MKTKKEIRITFHQRSHMLAKAKAKAKAERTGWTSEQKAAYEQSHSFRESLGGREW